MIKIVKNGENKLNTALENGKVVLLTRLNGDIINLKVFNTKEDLLKNYVKEQIKKEFDYLVYKTAREAYLLTCNNKYFTYLEEFTVNNWVDGESIKNCEKTRDNARNLLTYDKFVESINESDFKDGFYEWDRLMVPLIDGENFKYEYEACYGDSDEDEDYYTSFFVEDGEFEGEMLNGIFTFEILIKK